MMPKFRAWDKILKKMFYGKLEMFDDSIGLRFNHFEDNEPIFMQSTGLKDKNGKEIFEGDIVDVGTRVPFFNKIQKDKENGYLKLVPIDKRWSEAYFTNFEDKSRYEIVGNIYEDPELLEVEND